MLGKYSAMQTFVGDLLQHKDRQPAEVFHAHSDSSAASELNTAQQAVLRLENTLIQVQAQLTSSQSEVREQAGKAIGLRRVLHMANIELTTMNGQLKSLVYLADQSRTGATRAIHDETRRQTTRRARSVCKSLLTMYMRLWITVMLGTTHRAGILSVCWRQQRTSGALKIHLMRWAQVLCRLEAQLALVVRMRQESSKRSVAKLRQHLLRAWSRVVRIQHVAARQLSMRRAPLCRHMLHTWCMFGAQRRRRQRLLKLLKWRARGVVKRGIFERWHGTVNLALALLAFSHRNERAAQHRQWHTMRRANRLWAEAAAHTRHVTKRVLVLRVKGGQRASRVAFFAISGYLSLSRCLGAKFHVVSCRRMIRAYSRVMQTWLMCVAHERCLATCDHQMRTKQTRLLKMMMNKDVAAAFSGWYHEVSGTNKLRYKTGQVLRRLCQHALAMALEMWKRQSSQQSSMRTKSKRIVSRILNASLHKALDTWMYQASQERSMRTKSTRIMGRILKASLHMALDMWNREALSQQTMRTKSTRIISRILKASLRMALDMWRCRAVAQQTMRTKSTRIISRILNAFSHAGLDTWRRQAVAQRNMRSKSTRIISRILNGCLRTGLDSWRCRAVSQRNMRTKSTRIMRRIVNGCLHSALEVVRCHSTFTLHSAVSLGIHTSICPSANVS